MKFTHMPIWYSLSCVSFDLETFFIFFSQRQFSMDEKYRAGRRKNERPQTCTQIHKCIHEHSRALYSCNGAYYVSE